MSIATRIKSAILNRILTAGEALEEAKEQAMHITHYKDLETTIYHFPDGSSMVDHQADIFLVGTQPILLAGGE